MKQKLYKLKKPFINDLSIEICGGGMTPCPPLATRMAICTSQREIVLRKLDITITTHLLVAYSLLQNKSVFFSFRDAQKVLISSDIVQFVQRSKRHDLNSHCDMAITELLQSGTNVNTLFTAKSTRTRTTMLQKFCNPHVSFKIWGGWHGPFATTMVSRVIQRHLMTVQMVYSHERKVNIYTYNLLHRVIYIAMT